MVKLHHGIMFSVLNAADFFQDLRTVVLILWAFFAVKSDFTIFHKKTERE